MSAPSASAAATVSPRRELTSQCICPAALWGVRCRRQRVYSGCPFTHEVPPLARIHYDALRLERIARLQAENAAKVRSAKLAPRPPAPVGDHIERLRAEAVVQYDTDAHPFGQLIAAVLECMPGEALSALHLRPLPEEPPLCPTLLHAFRLNGRKLPSEFTNLMGRGRNRKLLAKLWASAAYRRWLDGYDAWVRAVVLPAAGGDAIYYQRPPTLRVAMPSVAATIGIHRDADYPRHQPAEINWWCPLVDVADSSALWLESAPGRGDFAPRALRVGEALRFNGSLCRHHTVANQSGTTRVSFDLRAIPAAAVVGEPPERIGDYDVAFMAP